MLEGALGTAYAGTRLRKSSRRPLTAGGPTSDADTVRCRDCERRRSARKRDGTVKPCAAERPDCGATAYRVPAEEVGAETGRRGDDGSSGDS